jgi:transcriptional regulator with XRE-family HTH domain
VATRRPKKLQGKPLADVLASRVRAHRERLNWTQDDLAERMTVLGFNWNRVTVAEAEGKGRGRRVTVEELLALAMVFGIGVVHLLALEEMGTEITDKVALSSAELRKVITVGSGVTGSPELRRMQLEFRREKARAELGESEMLREQAELRVERARQGLADYEEELAAIEHLEEQK